MIDEPKTDLQTYETQAQIFKQLTHPVRLAILEILRGGEHCVCHMEAHLGYRQAYISQQLMVMREAGLIQDRRDGWNVFYRVAEPRVFAILAAVEQMLPSEQNLLANRSAVKCNCPKCNAGEGS